MRNAVLFILIVVALTLLGASAVLYQSNRTASAQVEDLQSVNMEAEARYTRVFNAIAEIQDSLAAIKAADIEVQLRSTDEAGASAPNEREALERVDVIKTGIGRTKEKIDDLEVDLKKNGIEIRGLNRMIAGLKTTLSEQEERIDGLSTEIGALHSQVSGLEAEVQASEEELRQREQMLAERQRQLRTIYYRVGTKKELMDAGVVEAKGGFIGIGKTLKPAATFDASTFTSLDTQETTVLPTRATKAQVLSAQAASSYELRMTDGMMELHILDPEEFSKVKYLVILTS